MTTKQTKKLHFKCRSNALQAAPNVHLSCRDLAASTAPGIALKHIWSSNGHHSSCAGTPQLITGSFETQIHIALTSGCFRLLDTTHRDAFIILYKNPSCALSVY